MFQNDILTTTQLQQVENHIDKILPLLLTRNPAIVLTIEGILAQHFMGWTNVLMGWTNVLMG